MLNPFSPRSRATLVVIQKEDCKGRLNVAPDVKKRRLKRLCLSEQTSPQTSTNVSDRRLRRRLQMLASKGRFKRCLKHLLKRLPRSTFVGICRRLRRRLCMCIWVHRRAPYKGSVEPNGSINQCLNCMFPFKVPHTPGCGSSPPPTTAQPLLSSQLRRRQRQHTLYQLNTLSTTAQLLAPSPQLLSCTIIPSPTRRTDYRAYSLLITRACSVHS